MNNDISNGLGRERMEKLRSEVDAKRARADLIKSLGDSEIDWLGFDSADEIASYDERAINEHRADQWIKHAGSKVSLREHISKYRKPV